MGKASSDTKSNSAYKKIKGKQHTSNVREANEEEFGILVNPHATNIWVNDIPTTPPNTSNDIIEVLTNKELTPDITLTKQVWYVHSGGTRLKGFISPLFGFGYNIRVYDHSGGEIYSANDCNWEFDYENGILFFENDPTNYKTDDTKANITLPIKVKLHRYKGESLRSTGINTGDETKISIQNKIGKATNINDGYLSKEDWDSFNSKASVGGNLFDKLTDTSDDIEEGSNHLFYTDNRAIAAIGLNTNDSSSVDFTYDSVLHKLSANVKIDNSSLTVDTALKVKPLGITNAHLAGSISQDKLLGSIGEDKLDIVNTPSDTQVMSWSAADSKIKWDVNPTSVITTRLTDTDTLKWDKTNNLLKGSVSVDPSNGINSTASGISIKDLGVTEAKVNTKAITSPKISTDNSPSLNTVLSWNNALQTMTWGNSLPYTLNNTNSILFTRDDVALTIRANLKINSSMFNVTASGLELKDSGVSYNKLNTTNTASTDSIVSFDGTNLNWIDNPIKLVGENAQDSTTVHLEYVALTKKIKGSVLVDADIFDVTTNLSIKNLGVDQTKLKGSIPASKLAILSTPSSNSLLGYNTLSSSFEWKTPTLDSYKVLTSPTDSREGYLFEKVIGKSGAVHVTPIIGGGIDSYSVLVMHMDGSNQNFMDSGTSTHTFQVTGSVSQNSSIKKFGIGSAHNTSYTSYIEVLQSLSDFNFDSVPYTIDMQLRFSDLVNSQCIFSHGSGNSRATFGWNKAASNTLAYKVVIGGVTKVLSTAIWTPVVDTFYHIELVMKWDSCDIYVDGSKISTSTITTTAYPTLNTALGIFKPDGTDYIKAFVGYCDEFRVSKGIARNYRNFKPPVSEYDNSEALEIDIIGGVNLDGYFKLSQNTADDITGGVTNRFLTGNSVLFSDIATTNVPTDGQTIKYDGPTNSLVWDDAGSVSFPKATEIELGQATDGLFSFSSATLTQVAINNVDELLGELAPAPPAVLSGSPVYSGITFYSGYISDGNSLKTYTIGQNISNINKGIAAFSFSNPDSSTTQFGPADKGSIELRVNNVMVDSFNLETAFKEASRNGNQGATYNNGSGLPATSAGGFITILSVGKYNNFKKWQKGVVRANISGLSSGETFAYKLVHKVGLTEYNLTPVTWFYDGGGDNMSLTGYSVAENNVTNFKYLDGIKYYKTNDQFKFNMVASGIFKNTYISSPITHDDLSSKGFPAISIPFNDSHITGVSSVPKIAEVATVTDYVQSITGSNIFNTNDVSLIWRLSKPGLQKSYTQTISKMFINTYTNYDTPKVRYFKDNQYRLPHLQDWQNTSYSLTGHWFDSVPLENGHALVAGDLRYPSIDYSGYTTFPVQTANYSAFSGDQIYLTTFRDAGIPHSNGILTIPGITVSDLSSNVKIELRLPTITGWLDLGKSFDPGTFTGVDGNGCRISDNGASFNYSLGSFSTSYCDYRLQVRVTLKNANRIITMINTNW